MPDASGAMRFDQARQHLAGSEFDEAIDPHLGHRRDAFAPADRRGDLLYQQVADSPRIGFALGRDIRHQRHARRVGR